MPVTTPFPTSVHRACALMATLLLPLGVAAADSADRLVDLLRPHERDMQKLGFLVKSNPFTAVPAGLPECDMAQASPTLRAAYVQQYRQQLSAKERDAAIAYFGSPTGQAIVKNRQQREATVMEAADSKKTVSESSLEDPAPLKASLAAFHATPAGRRFADDAIDKEGPGAQALEQIRNEALMRCLRGADAATKKLAADAAPVTPPASAKRESSNREDVRFVLENQGGAEQSGFFVDLYPNTPVCDRPPVTVVQSSSPMSAQDKVHNVDIPPNKPLSFVMRATYPGSNGGEASCSPGAMTFLPSSGSEYRAVFRERGTNCWVELWSIDLENNRSERRLPVTAKPVKVDASGKHSCDWAES